jgi:hypothetical protein
MRLFVYFLCRFMSNEESKKNEMSGTCGMGGEKRQTWGNPKERTTWKT